MTRPIASAVAALLLSLLLACSGTGAPQQDSAVRVQDRPEQPAAKCGKNVCEPGQVCCNESCSICAAPGQACIKKKCLDSQGGDAAD
jgi:hypothetical protein